jgi:hypothetical protein
MIWSNKTVIVIILDIMVISQFLKLLSLFFSRTILPFSNSGFKETHIWSDLHCVPVVHHSLLVWSLKKKKKIIKKPFSIILRLCDINVQLKIIKKPFSIILRLCGINVQLICRLIARVTVQLSLSTSNHVYIETEVEVKELHPTKCLTWTGLERTSLLLKVNLKRRTKNENPTKSIRHQSSPLSYTR